MQQLLLTALSALVLVTPRCCLAQRQVVAQRFAVASGHVEATKIGLEVLRSGGNVVDAAIATSLALGVAEPYGSGLGGKLVWLYRDAATGKVTSIVALCTSPQEMDPTEFVQLPRNERKYGYRAVGVPGLVAGLAAAHERWGSKPWSELVEPAANLAEAGITIDATMQGLYRAHVKDLRRDAEAANLYLYQGELPPIGARFKNADLAATLRDLASNGPRSFYTGPTAQRIVKAARAAGAPLSVEDLKAYQAEVGEPLSIDYRGNRIYSCPPPLTGGSTVLAALKCFEELPQLDQTARATDFADQMGHVLLVLYPEIQDQLADVPTARAAAEQLLAAAKAKQVAEEAGKIDPRKPYPQPSKIEQTSDALPVASTSHLVVADAAGNMVSLTQSLSLHFGAAVVAPETGFLLNDSMSNFSTHNPGTVNYAAAGKRARSTIAPILVTRAGKPALTLGIPGGQRIPTTTVYLLWQLLDQQKSLANTFAASRFHLMRPVTKKQPFNRMEFEVGSAEAWKSQLEALGWQTKSHPRDGHYFGGGNAIQYAADGTLIGVADPRRTNAVAGE